MKDALYYDISKDYKKAVECYEFEINHNRATGIGSYCNLAFLYWAFAALQMEFNTENQIPDEWSIIGGQRYQNTIDSGLKNYPKSLELNFWNRYFSYRLFMTEFTKEDCEKLMNDFGDKESLIPYFFLNLFDKEKYSYKVKELLQICHETPTAKNIYVQSFLI